MAPALFEEALSLYEQEKWKHNIENVGLVDTEKENTSVRLVRVR